MPTGLTVNGLNGLRFLVAVEDWDLYEQLLDYTYASQLRTESYDHPLMMSECPVRSLSVSCLPRIVATIHPLCCGLSGFGTCYKHRIGKMSTVPALPRPTRMVGKLPSSSRWEFVSWCVLGSVAES